MTGEVTFEEFKAFEGSMSDAEPLDVEITKEREEFLARRKLEKTAAKKTNIDEGIAALQKYSDTLGILNYESLAEAGLIFAARDDNN